MVLDRLILGVYDCVVSQRQVQLDAAPYLSVFWPSVRGMMDDVFIGGQFSEVAVYAPDWKTRLRLMDIHSRPELTAQLHVTQLRDPQTLHSEYTMFIHQTQFIRSIFIRELNERDMLLSKCDDLQGHVQNTRNRSGSSGFLFVLLMRREGLNQMSFHRKAVPFLSCVG